MKWLVRVAVVGTWQVALPAIQRPKLTMARREPRLLLGVTLGQVGYSGLVRVYNLKAAKSAARRN